MTLPIVKFNQVFSYLCFGLEVTWHRPKNNSWHLNKRIDKSWVQATLSRTLSQTINGPMNSASPKNIFMYIEFLFVLSYHRFYKAIFCLKYTNVIFITEFSLFIFPISEIHTIGYQPKPDAQWWFYLEFCLSYWLESRKQ